MTSTKQKGDLEAAATENELTDLERDSLEAFVEQGATVDEALEKVLEDRTDEPPTLEPEPAPAEEPTEPTREQLRKLDVELKRHEEAVRITMGGFVAGFQSCDACGGVGLIPPDPGPPTHDYFRECPTCRGWTVVRTGAKEPNHATRPCPGCKGRGYLEAMRDGRPLAEDQGAGVAVPSPASAPPPTEPAAGVTENGAGELEFGTPQWMGDPNVGQT